MRTAAKKALYKSTRPDGTDFRTGSIDYTAALASGETIEHPAGAAGLEPGHPWTYISAATIPTGCTGMRWPCRLFRVEAVGRARRVDDMPYKRACHALRVVEELPAHEALGPQGREIAALIERARRLTPEDVRRWAVAWTVAWAATRESARDSARNAALNAVRNAARDAAWGAARDAAWDAALNATRDAAWDAALNATRVAAWDSVWDAARTAAWAALAVIVRDLISPEHHELLHGPMARALEDGGRIASSAATRRR